MSKLLLISIWSFLLYIYTPVQGNCVQNRITHDGVILRAGPDVYGFLIYQQALIDRNPDSVIYSKVYQSSPNSPQLFNVIVKDNGSGVICSETDGVIIGLDGSEVGIKYKLFKNADAVQGVQPIDGNGNPIFFPAQNHTGIYTVKTWQGLIPMFGFEEVINDTEAPSIACPDTILICLLPDESLDYTPVEGIAPTINDSCSWTYSFTLSGATTTMSPVSGDASTSVSGINYNVGITTVLYTVVDVSGNTNSCSFQIEVIEYQVADAGPAVIDSCEKTAIRLTGNVATMGTSHWYQDMTTGAPAATLTQVLNEADADYLIAGYTYKFVYEITNGPCTSDDTITYNNWLPASASLAGFDQELCNATSFALAGNTPAAGEGRWIQISGPSCTFTDIHNPALEVTAVTPGQYAFVWKIVNGPVCLPENDEVLITVYPMVTVDAGGDDIVCPNADYYEVTDADALNYSSLFWQATGTGYFDNVTITNPKYYFSLDDIAMGTVTLKLHGYDLGPCPDVLDEMVLTINDFTNPVIASCAPDQDVNLDADCGLLVPDLTTAVVVSDNCTDIVITQVPAAGDILASSHNQEHVVTITVTDIRNNTATCMVTFTGKDVTAPVISVCAPAQNVNLDADCKVMVPNLLPYVAASDNCTYTLTQDPAAGTQLNSAHDSTHTVVITATDGAMLTATCSVVIQAKDITPPEAKCYDSVNVELSDDTTGTIVIYPTNVDNGSSDNCGLINLVSVSPNTFDCSHIGVEIPIILTVQDPAGLTDTCSTTVTVHDDSPPHAICKDITVYLDNLGKTTITPAMINESSWDNCNAINLLASKLDFDCSNIGTNSVTLTAKDAGGLKDSCQATVTVLDNIYPVITFCPADVIQSNDPGQCGAVVNNITPVLWDNCPGYTSAYTLSGVTTGSSSGSVSGVFFNKGITMVTYTVIDIHENSTTCQFTVTITDNEDPTITCPVNLTQTAAVGVCNAAVTIPVPTTGDNCGIPTVVNSFNSTNNASGTYPIGTTSVTYTVTDSHGNSTSCLFTVTITDNEFPTISCPVNLTQTAAVGVCNAAVPIPVPTTSDNCGIATVVNNFNGTNSASGTYPVGTTAVTYTVTDIYGNLTTCLFTVTITDNEFPTISCPANITQQAGVGICDAAVTIPVPTTSDNCGIATVVNNFNSTNNASGTYPVGTTPVTYTVTDIYGNLTTCLFTVTIIDNEFPTISCPANITQTAGVSICDATVTIPVPITGDNCGVATVENNLNGTNNASGTYPVGTTPVTYTVTDIHGNWTTCQFTVTITDNEVPFIQCPTFPNPIRIENSSNCTYNIGGTEFDPDSTNDNCSFSFYNNVNQNSTLQGESFSIGQHTIIWTIQDNANNTATCSIYIEFIKPIDPPIIYGDDFVCRNQRNVQYWTSDQNRDLDYEWLLLNSAGIIPSPNNNDTILINWGSGNFANTILQLKIRDLITECEEYKQLPISISNQIANDPVEVYLFTSSTLGTIPNLSNQCRWGYIPKDLYPLGDTFFQSCNGQQFCNFGLVDPNTNYYFVDDNISDDCPTRSFYNAPPPPVSGYIENIFILGMKIFPNPSAEYVTLETFVLKGDLARLQIYNKLGVLLQSQSVELSPGLFQQVIPIHRFSEGMYIIGLEFSDGRQVYSKLIKLNSCK